MANSLIVQKASAGSGKTYQLALNFIRMTLGEPDCASGRYRLFYPLVRNRHREILAVTFTNKATEEMKQRIIKELRALADLTQPSNYRSTLLDDFRVDAKKLAEAAGAALNDILFDYGNLHVSTIDAFFQTVLRSFAYEADLSGNYDLELEDKLINEQAINDTLAAAMGTIKLTPQELKVNNPKQLRSWLQIYITKLRKEAGRFDLLNPNNQSRGQLLDFVNKLTDEKFKEEKSKIIAFADDPSKITALHDELKDKLQALSDSIAGIASEIPIEHLDGRKSKLRNMVKRAAGGWPIDAKFDDYKEIYSSINHALTMVKPGCEASEGKVKALIAQIQLYYTALNIFANIHNYGLFSAILRFADRLKIDHNTILLSDTNTLLNQIIGDSDAPFIYERIGRRFRHYLIDEFQDTSRLQWKNLRPLLLESLGEGNYNLIIGDVKQCIYRFRNSDPQLLDSEIMTDKEVGQHIQLSPHYTNFRSSQVVVEFNNELFEALGRNLDFPSVYAGVRQSANKTDLPGYVKIDELTEKGDQALDNMVNEMVRQLDPAQGNYRPGDIAVLVRENKQAQTIVSYLLKETAEGQRLEGVNILSDEALMVGASAAVQDIVASLRRMIEPQKEKEYSMYSTSEIAMTRFNERLHQLTSEGLTPNEALGQALDELRSNSLAKTVDGDINTRGLSLFEIVESLIARLPADWRTRDAIYLHAFQDMVLDYCRTVNPNIFDFIDYWTTVEKKASIGFAGNVDAIRVITIHKSKGLEFPCVHIPIMPKTFVREDDFRWYDAKEAFEVLDMPCVAPDYFPIKSNSTLQASVFSKQLEQLYAESRLDELNALYVAFTRAERELIVTLQPPKSGADNVTRHIQAVLNGRKTFGEPTRRDLKKNPEVSTPIPVASYQISPRPNPWRFTLVSPEEFGS